MIQNEEIIGRFRYHIREAEKKLAGDLPTYDRYCLKLLLPLLIAKYKQLQSQQQDAINEADTVVMEFN